MAQVFSQSGGFINAVYMKNTLQGFIEGNPVGGRWSLWKTNNGGVNWDSTGLYLAQYAGELGWPNSLCSPFYPFTNTDTNKIWFGTNNYRIYYSSNFGQNWMAQSTSPEQNSYCICYDSQYPSTLVLSGGSNYVLSTTNYGLNWTTTTIGGSGNIVGITKCPFNFYLTRGNSIFIRQSSGNWYQFYTPSSGSYTYMDNRGSKDHYAVRTNGGITFLIEMEEIKNISSNIPESFGLHQNYPNPFNPTTKIDFDIPKETFAVMKVYDINGKLIDILFDQSLKPGSYSTTFNVQNLASGIYFYSLQTSEFTKTNKMIILK